MRKFKIFYKDNRTTDVLLLPHKNKKYYSFINLTKGHICPCKFKTEEEAIEDLRSYKNIRFFIELKGEKMVARLTRPLDEFECRIAGGCPLEEWLDKHNIKDYESEYFCGDCPFEVYINRLAEYEDGSVIE